MANRILAQTDNVAGCGAVIGCSGATIAVTPQAREATKDGTPGVTELENLIGLGATQAGAMFQSANNEPGETTWDAGDWVVRLNVTTSSEYLTWVATYVCRFNNACGSLAVVGSLTGQSISLGTTGVKQMTVSGAEQSANLSDEIYIVLIFNNSFTHGDRGFGFTPDQNIDTPIVLAAGVQTLIPDGIASLENFGILKANFKMYPSAIESLEAHGIPNVINLMLLPGGIEPLEGFGNGKLNLKLFPEYVPSGEGHGTPKFTLELLPSAIESEEAFGEAVVKLVQSLYPDAIASLEGFGDSKLNLRLLLPSIASLEGFGAASVIRSLSPSAIASLEGFGSPQLNFVLSPPAIVSGEAFGTARFVLYLLPSSIISEETFGTSKLGLWILPTSIISSEAFGALTVVLGGMGVQYLYPDGIVTEEGIGQPQLDFIIFPEGIASLEAFGFDSLLKLFPKLFKVMPRERIFEVLSRARTFKIGPRKRIFPVDRR